MKKIYTLLLLGFCMACNESEIKKTKRISVVVDFTDQSTLRLLPNTSAVLRLYNLDIDKEAEAWLRLRAITDKKLSPTALYHLRSEVDMEQYNSTDDLQFRERSLMHFYDTVKKSIDAFYGLFKNKTYDYSQCFENIAAELNALAQYPDDERYLLIYSDLAERNIEFNAYSTSDTITAEDVAVRLEAILPLASDLHGIRVYIVFEPTTISEDTRFKLMAEAYKIMLEKKRGAQVFIQASTQTFLL